MFLTFLKQNFLKWATHEIIASNNAVGELYNQWVRERFLRVGGVQANVKVSVYVLNDWRDDRSPRLDCMEEIK